MTTPSLYYMSIGDTEHLQHGPYENREQAALDAVIRQSLSKCLDEDPSYYTICKIIPSHENAIKQSTDLPAIMLDWIDEWVNDNVEGGTEDGVVEINYTALEVLHIALNDILTNHSIYHGNGAATECVDTTFY